jgi:hypothetical protein
MEVPSRFCELREELTIVFMSEESETADLLNQENWCNKVAFLADTSQALNTLTTVCSKRMKIFLLVLTKLTLLRKK